MDIVNLLRDHNVMLASEQDRHYRSGWINMECPYCSGNPGNHLGYDLQGDKFHCWRCGGKSTPFTVAKLLHVNVDAAKEILKDYGYTQYNVKPNIKIRKKAFKLPDNIHELKQKQIRYLENRGFDPDYIIKKYGLLSSGPISKLDNIDYSYRLIIPIYWEDEMVSFTARDYTDKQKEKYKTCPKDRELIFHKNILYRNAKTLRSTGLIVEGPTDVWRMGDNSIATFGIKFLNQQVRIIAKLFKRVAILYDPDPQAQIQAKLLNDELRFRNVDSFIVDLKQDPGSLPQTEADYLIKQLIK